MEVPLTPIELLRRARALYGHREAVVEGEVRRDYDALFERVARLAAGLQSLGVAPHDRVACVLPNGSALLESHCAVAQVGAVLVPLGPQLGREDYTWILRHCRARIVIADAALMDVFDATRRDLLCVERFVSIGGWQHAWLRYEDLLERAGARFEPVDVAERDPIAIEYAVRGEARPRAIVHTHRSAWLQAIGAMLHVPVARGERYLWTLPMRRSAGWGQVWALTAAGATHVMPHSHDPRTLLELIERECIDALGARPALLASLVQAALADGARPRRGLRVLTGGGAPDPRIIETAERDLGWQLTQAYGLAETAGMIAIDERDAQGSGARRVSRQGVETLSGGQLRVLDAGGSDVPADGATIGEVHVRGNAVMLGCYEDPAATARLLRGGWLRTGDRGVVHPDGSLEIRERRDDVIISGGERIAPAEIERLLLPVAGVREVAVLGVPDARLGEVPHAFVLVRKGCRVTAEQLSDLASRALAPYKRPVEYHFVPAMPKTPTGTPDREALQRQLEPGA